MVWPLIFFREYVGGLAPVMMLWGRPCRSERYIHYCVAFGLSYIIGRSDLSFWMCQGRFIDYPPLCYLHLLGFVSVYGTVTVVTDRGTSRISDD